MNDTIARLKWQCRRGTKELDNLLENYLTKYYDGADHTEKTLFRQILTLRDTELIQLLLAEQSALSDEMVGLVRKIRSFSSF